MSFIDQTFEHYVQMRHSGMNAKGALEALRDHIESLASNERAELVRRVKSWEGQRSGKGGNETKPRVSAECPRCFEPNPAGELFCAHCGYFLGGDSSQHETTRLSDPEQLERGSDYFGPDSVLVLMLPNNQAFNVQPQRYRHET